MRAAYLALATSGLCPVVAGVFYLAGRLAGDRMVAAGQGWEIAFYLSPLVFWSVEAVLVLGAGAGIVAAVAGPRWRLNVGGLTVGLVNAASFAWLPWR